jgi:tetratricopeptide (TPR) repeat protein
MTRALRAVAALTLLAAPLAAQNPIADRMLSLSGKAYPEDITGCKLSGGDFHVSSAATYLTTALTTPIADNKIRALLNGHDQALQGINGGGAGSSKAWYNLGRVDLQQGDLAGADSAFTKVVRLTPTCATEVTYHRTRAWSILMTAAIAARTASHADSSIILARAANQIAPDRPQGWYTIGAYYLEQQQNDSAMRYLQMAFDAPTDTTPITQGVRQAAAYQYGVLAFNAHDFAGAARGFGIAVRLKPDDGDARRNLAAALRQAGMADSAQKIEQSMMAAAAGTEAGLSVDQLFAIGVAQFNQHDYPNAAATFEKIIAVEPFNRDALYNLANAYFGLNNGDKLLETSLKLQAIDPLSYEVMQLVGSAYRLKHDQPNLMRTATALGGATISLAATGFTQSADHATLTLKATGRDGRDVNDRPVRGAPIPIVVEFLDKAGTVVATADATVPVLAANATQDLPVTGTGAGIIAWRYHRK